MIASCTSANDSPNAKPRVGDGEDPRDNNVLKRQLSFFIYDQNSWKVLLRFIVEYLDDCPHKTIESVIEVIVVHGPASRNIMGNVIAIPQEILPSDQGAACRAVRNVSVVVPYPARVGVD